MSVPIAPSLSTLYLLTFKCSAHVSWHIFPGNPAGGSIFWGLLLLMGHSSSWALLYSLKSFDLLSISYSSPPSLPSLNSWWYFTRSNITLKAESSVLLLTPHFLAHLSSNMMETRESWTKILLPAVSSRREGLSAQRSLPRLRSRGTSPNWKALLTVRNCSRKLEKHWEAARGSAKQWQLCFFFWNRRCLLLCLLSYTVPGSQGKKNSVQFQYTYLLEFLSFCTQLSCNSRLLPWECGLQRHLSFNKADVKLSCA